MIYIVWYRDFYNGREFCGAFSTEEKAKAYIDKFTDDKQNFDIEQHYLDDLE